MLPTSTSSAAAVEFCGFTAETAECIFNRFQNRRTAEKNPDDLVDYMRGDTLGSGKYNRTPPAEALTRMGLKPQVRDAILDERFHELRMTETTTSWAINTMETNWKTLIRLIEYPPDEAKGERIAATDLVCTATVRSSLEGLSEQQSMPSAYVAAVKCPPSVLPGHLVLYSAAAAVAMDDWIDEEDGSILRPGSRTNPGGDFTFDRDAYYWTPDCGTAELHRAYMRARCPQSEIWMLRAQVDESFVNTLNTKELWYGRDWKEFVWHCRKTSQPPPEFCHLGGVGEVDLIKGHVSKSDGVRFIKDVKEQDIHEGISQGNVMITPEGQPATQWCLASRDGIHTFAREIKGKMHIEISRPLHDE